MKAGWRLLPEVPPQQDSARLSAEQAGWRCVSVWRVSYCASNVTVVCGVGGSRGKQQGRHCGLTGLVLWRDVVVVLLDQPI
jgi:hypothetical protein